MGTPLDVLIGQLQSSDAAGRLRAAEGIIALGRESLPALDALIVALDDPDADVRLAAVHGLGVLDPTEAEPGLDWAMQSDDYRVAVAARMLVHGTAKLRGPDSTVWRDPALGRGE